MAKRPDWMEDQYQAAVRHATSVFGTMGATVLTAGNRTAGEAHQRLVERVVSEPIREGTDSYCVHAANAPTPPMMMMMSIAKPGYFACPSCFQLDHATRKTYLVSKECDACGETTEIFHENVIQLGPILVHWNLCSRCTKRWEPSRRYLENCLRDRRHGCDLSSSQPLMGEWVPRWVLTDSNHRPLPCKGRSGHFVDLGVCQETVLHQAFRFEVVWVVSRCLRHLAACMRPSPKTRQPDRVRVIPRRWGWFVVRAAYRPHSRSQPTRTRHRHTGHRTGPDAASDPRLRDIERRQAPRRSRRHLTVQIP